MSNLKEVIDWFNKHPMKPRSEGFSSLPFTLVPAMEEAIEVMIKVSLGGDPVWATDWLDKWWINERD